MRVIYDLKREKEINATKKLSMKHTFKKLLTSKMRNGLYRKQKGTTTRI